MTKLQVSAIAGVLLALVAPAAAQTPLGTEFTYQGQLKDAGSPASGTYDLRFALYDQLIGGTQQGPTVCVDNLVVADGLFTLELDFGTQFAGQERFLQIEVRTDTGLNCGNQTGFVTLSPRQALTAAPNALFALNADKLDGLDSTVFLQSIPVPLTLSGTSSTHIIRGENASTGNSSTGVYGRSTGASGTTSGVYGRSDSSSGYGVFGEAPATSGTNYGGRFRSLSTSGTGVFGEATATSGTTYGGLFQNASSSGVAVRGWATATSGATDGGRFESNSTSGRGVFGLATAASGTTTGVYGVSESTTGRGVYGYAPASSGLCFGGLFESASTSGIGVRGIASATSGSCYGGYFESASPLGRGVVGIASATSSSGSIGGYFGSVSTGGFGVLAEESAASGETYGVYASSDSTAGRGVFGLARAGSGTTYGGYFHANSTSGRGVYGHTSSASGSTYGGYFESDSTSGYGVYGRNSATSGTIYGVRGYASTAAGGYAVYAAGDMGASGVKPFRIDHPSNPENKYLLHYAAESPEVINFYRGTVMLDERGEAVVELPAYFGMINKTPSYQLTAVGAPMPNLHVAEEISEEALSAGEQAGPADASPICWFRIAGGVSGAKVSWEVKAVRNDLRMRLHGAPVEREKTGPERGKYQHPEYYGQPPEMGTDFQTEGHARCEENHRIGHGTRDTGER